MNAKRSFLSVLACGFLFAQTADAVVNIQNVGAGARSMAMGNSFVAVADNADAVFENPAGLGQIESRQVSYTNVSLFFSGVEGDNLGQHVVSFVQPLGSRLGLGLGFERIGSDLMSENGAFLSLSMSLGKNLHLGLNGKYLFWSVGAIEGDDLSDTSNGTIGIDLGALWQSPVASAKVGVMLKNLNQPNAAKGSGVVNGVTDPDAGKLPMDLHLGVAYQVNPASMVSVQWVVRDLTADKVNIATGETDPDTGDAITREETSRTTKLVIGGETRLVQGLMLRAGGSRPFEDDTSGDLNAGLGYAWTDNMTFDYSYHIPLELTETDGAHRFSIGYQF